MKSSSILFLLFLTVVALTINLPHDKKMLSVPTVHAKAQEEDQMVKEDSMMEEESEPEATNSSEVTIEYNMPYPGMLPDHPLYFLKNMRDRILNFLIKDPVKRIEFLTLMADKRYAMGTGLTEKEKYDKAVTIVEEAEDYYGQIAGEIQNALDAEKDINAERFETLEASAKKHEQILEDIINNSPEEYKERYEKIHESLREDSHNISEKRN